MAEGLFALADYLPGDQISDFLEVAVIRPIYDLNLLHPPSSIPVEVITAEAFEDRPPSIAGLEFVSNAVAHSKTVVGPPTHDFLGHSCINIACGSHASS